MLVYDLTLHVHDSSVIVLQFKLFCLMVYVHTPLSTLVDLMQSPISSTDVYIACLAYKHSSSAVLFLHCVYLLIPNIVDRMNTTMLFIISVCASYKIFK